MTRRSIQPYHSRTCLPAVLVFFIVLSGLFVSAQPTSGLRTSSPPASVVKGHVRDTILGADCSFAVISVLGSDSTLLKFTRSHKDGSFVIYGLPPGGYRLMVSHPAYSAFFSTLIVREGAVTDLGIIAPPPKVGNLEAVIVTAKNVPPKINGDTLEFNAANVKTKVNASVEDLLTRLPGVRVDQNGGITVNGKKIDKLLVDGEDLFGGDPTIVTRNFNADMIAKVQVLERKSDQTQFTGIEDGQTTKTLNLTLKPESKKGYFSKAEAGGDPQGYYNVNALLGAFKDHRQLAALGMAANTGSTGFSGAVGDLGSGLNVGGGTNDALGASAGAGIPRVLGGGIHFADKWNGAGDHVVGNYNYGRLVTHPFSSSIVRQTLPDSIYVQQQSNRSDNSQEQHTMNADFDYLPDTLSAFRFSVGGMNMQGHNALTDTGSSSFNDTLVNSSIRMVHSDVQNQNFRGSAMWRIRGAKRKGRMFSVVAGFAKQDNESKGFLYSRNTFYQPGGSILRTDTIDQRKLISTNGLFVNSSLNYTEPLWKNAVLGFSYGLSFNRSQSLLSTYNRGDGKYEDYIDSLSNHYRNDVLTQRATLNLQVTDKTFSYTIGGDLLHFGYRQKDLIKDSVLRYRYLNVAPRVNMRYNFDSYRGFTFDYNGYTQQPSITQLQPVQNNNDPLHVTLGNPDLHPSFSHHFGLGFHNLRPLVINVGLNYGFTTNGISTRTYTDSLGRQVSQAVNTAGSSNGGVYFSINRKLTGLDLDLGLNTNLDYGRSVNYVNQYLSRNDNYNTGGGIFVNKFVPDKYSIQLNTGFNYSYSRSSINPGAATHYWTQGHSGAFSVFLLKDFEINTNFYYSWRQKLDNFDNHNSTMVWNAYVNRNFLANRLALRWQINDILGQNAGISRSISTNQTSENTFNIIGRYWMISAIYRFVHRRKTD